VRTVILAGGTGKRVFPLAVNTPKPMFRVLGKPLIRNVVETLKEASLVLALIIRFRGKP
jgi:NDP-sugar pyrophosphorylase family protein